MSAQTQKQPAKFGIGLTLVGILLIIFLTALPLVLVKDSDFAGSDGAGAAAVEAIAPDYNPNWISNIWEPPGGETESMLFALQAVAGGILIGYFFGYMRGRKAGPRDSED
ncbi:MAG: energy-coupling factor ABC transporter substrate-binding protein [Chloroflexi bacterium]|nr:MAG: energy-coupling factor ABC transporter substrate-binding protein [Chloroflexota bacterium]